MKVTNTGNKFKKSMVKSGVTRLSLQKSFEKNSSSFHVLSCFCCKTASQPASFASTKIAVITLGIKLLSKVEALSHDFIFMNAFCISDVRLISFLFGFLGD